MKIKTLGLCLFLVLFCTESLWATGDAFTKYEASFKNFLTCELTRTDAVDHFKGKEFTITMVKLHGVQEESGLVILTGAVQCFVGENYRTLYAAVGVEKLVDKEVVSYFTIRKNNFYILATELIKFPYQERCPWSRYWVDLD